jgi:hypothetical protein
MVRDSWFLGHGNNNEERGWFGGRIMKFTKVDFFKHITEQNDQTNSKR